MSDSVLVDDAIPAPAIQLDLLTPVMAFLAGVDWIFEWFVIIGDAGTAVDTLVECSRRD